MTPSGKLVSACAKAMCDRAELVWEALPEKPDMACGHGMPEGCRQYWYYLAQAAIAIVLERMLAMCSDRYDEACKMPSSPGLVIAGEADRMKNALLALSDRSRE